MKKMFLDEETKNYYEELKKIGLMDTPEEVEEPIEEVVEKKPKRKKAVNE